MVNVGDLSIETINVSVVEEVNTVSSDFKLVSITNHLSCGLYVKTLHRCLVIV